MVLRALRPPQPLKVAKVFCFFFSKKKRFLSVLNQLFQVFLIIAAGRRTRDDVAPGIARLAARYSAAAERDALRLMLERIEGPRDAIMPTRQTCQA